MTIHPLPKKLLCARRAESADRKARRDAEARRAAGLRRHFAPAPGQEVRP